MVLSLEDSSKPKRGKICRGFSGRKPSGKTDIGVAKDFHTDGTWRQGATYAGREMASHQDHRDQGRSRYQFPRVTHRGSRPHYVHMSNPSIIRGSQPVIEMPLGPRDGNRAVSRNEMPYEAIPYTQTHMDIHALNHLLAPLHLICPCSHDEERITK